MISSTYATYTEGKVATAYTFAYIYRHVNEFFLNYFYFFLLFLFYFYVGVGATTPPPPVHVAECKSYTTCREMCAARYTRNTPGKFPRIWIYEFLKGYL